MSDLRGYSTPGEVKTSSRSKLIAAVIVASGIAAGGAYAYLAPNATPAQPAQKIAVNEPVPLTPTQSPVMQTPAVTQPAAAIDTPKVPDRTAAKLSSAPVERVAHVKARAPEPAPVQQETAPVMTPPDTTQVPATPSQTATPPMATPDVAVPQDNTAPPPPAPDQSAPQTPQ